MNPPERRPDSLTRQQLLMWTGQHLAPQKPIYNIGFRIDLPMAIDPELFERAFRILVDRAAPLRTVVEMVRGVPHRSQPDVISFDFLHLDFSDSSDADSETVSWCDRRCGQLFDLTKRMFDSALIKRGEQEYTWYFANHHLISDAWGVTQLMRSLSEIYQALAAGNDAPPEESQVDFPADRPQAVVSVEEEFPPLQFYGRNPARIGPDSVRIKAIESGDRHARLLEELCSAPEARSFSRELSQFNVYLTLMFAFLHRVSGASELCIGAPFHNRMTADAKRSPGMFIELYPVNVSVSDDETFATLLNKVQAASNDYLRSAMADTSPAGSNAKFNAVFNFINAQFGEFAGTAVEAHWLHPGSNDQQHQLRMHVEFFNGGTQPDVKLDLNEDVFDASMRPEVVGHYRRLIEAMADDWNREIQNVDLLSDREREHLVTEFNASGAGDSTDVVTAFASMAAERPDGSAVSCGDRSLTYMQLDERSDSVAAKLAGLELPDGARVAICMSRSEHVVVSMLGALKAGVAFVPMDPEWPESRKAFLIDDSGVTCVLTVSGTEINVPGRIEVDLVEHSAFEAQSVDDTDAAYVLYTSGSTGQPKGVEISRASLANYANWAASFYGRGGPVSFPLFTPLTFDLTLTSIFVPVLTGGQVVAYPDHSDSAGITLLDVVDDDRVDAIKLTPSHLSLLEGRELKSSRVRQLILGGENLGIDTARRTLAVFPEGTVIHNEYGPTEATVGCVVYSFNANSRVDGPSVPIGNPISGMKAYVLNAHMHPQPAGVEGELYIGGKGLASCYAGRPDLTEERFVASPFVEGERLYRTGDVVRLDRQDRLVYLGRNDHQVKIKGARIELGEIESALGEYPGISRAVVATFDPAASDDEPDYCRNCGLASNCPDVTFDEQMVCNVCRSFDSYRQKAETWFRPMEELGAIFNTARAERTKLNGSSINQDSYDCISLLSGGKDSTYMLARLADMGLKILAFTLDNGYISDEAKANIRRVCETLGVDQYVGSTPAMNEIFVDSLKRHANVCQGCFKTIYTLSMNLARERGIPFIVTGLSRGQFFETRLTADLFTGPANDLVQIDQTVLEARKAYHRVDDAVYQLMDVEHLQSEEIFDQVRVLDFYRYCDVDLDVMLDYLDERLPWVRPSDTGRSTNCLINDVGIYVHKRRMGFHNYALPYSWDVRMGHKQREAALDELNDEINVEDVHRILNEIGFDGDPGDSGQTARLVAYYVSEEDVPGSTLNEHLKMSLPSFMIPGRYVRVDEIPLTPNGKVDIDALPDPTQESSRSSSTYFAPSTETESILANIWQEILRVDRIGVRDNFFDLGGDSILAIQIVARSHREGIRITPSQFFDSLTVETLARTWEESGDVEADEADEVEPILTPVQHWMLSHTPQTGDFWNQSIGFSLPEGSASPEGIDRLRETIAFVVAAHPSLRTSISHDGPELHSEIDSQKIPLEVVDLSDSDSEAGIDVAVRRICEQITIGNDLLVGGVVTHQNGSAPEIVLVADHTSVDAVSLQLLIDDFAATYDSITHDSEPVIRQRSTYARWSNLLANAASERFETQAPFWQQVMAAPAPVQPAAESGSVGNRRTHVLLIDEKLTRELKDDVPATRFTVEEVLLAALGQTINSLTGRDRFRLFIERHGREEISERYDFSQTIGWFTSLSPVSIDLTDTSSSAVVQKTKEALRDLPNRGIGFGILRYLHPTEVIRKSLEATHGCEVVFNYLGKQHSVRPDSAFSITRPLALHRSSSIKSFSAIDVNVSLGQQLRIEFEVYHRSISDEQISALADAYENALSAMVKWCGSEGADSASPSDFPLAGLDASQLEQLSSLLGQNESGDRSQQ
ncbi:MAG: amino acid adenylation domain-containing protein [Planctomycetota bacterium]